MKLRLCNFQVNLPLLPGKYEIGREGGEGIFLRSGEWKTPFCALNLSVSRFRKNGAGHLTIEFDGEKAVLIDNESTLGSFCNEVMILKLTLNKAGSHTIRMGNMYFNLTLK